ncbi:MAG: methionine synthase [Streptococcaceae bacterium]|nr:methionine synthase [Streptococcaceae bacterium]
MLPLKKSEILRYLGYRKKQELTTEISTIIDEIIIEAQKIAKPRYCYQIFGLKIDENDNTVEVLETKLVLTGKKIINHLYQAKQVALLVATLGVEVERKMQCYDISNTTKSLIMDAVCTDYIEKVCDLAEIDLKNKLGNFWHLNSRFSPGYGDLPLSVQPKLLEITQALQKLGIHLSENLLMTPKKSVTGIIGIFDQKELAKPRWKMPKKMNMAMVQQCSLRVK